MQAYVDTSAFIAFLDRSDSHHPLFFRLFSRPPALLTTLLVIGEGHAWFPRRYDRTRAMQFIAFIEQLKPLKLAAIGAAEQTGAAGLLRRFSDQALTLSDAVGLHLMQVRRLSCCWSTDFQLRLTGVPLVIDEA